MMILKNTSTSPRASPTNVPTVNLILQKVCDHHSRGIIFFDAKEIIQASNEEASQILKTAKNLLNGKMKQDIFPNVKDSFDTIKKITTLVNNLELELLVVPFTLDKDQYCITFIKKSDSQYIPYLEYLSIFCEILSKNNYCPLLDSMKRSLSFSDIEKPTFLKKEYMNISNEIENLAMPCHSSSKSHVPCIEKIFKIVFDNLPKLKRKHEEDESTFLGTKVSRFELVSPNYLEGNESDSLTTQSSSKEDKVNQKEFKLNHEKKTMKVENCKVLIVDDSEISHVILNAGLRLLGFQAANIYKANNGLIGLAMFKEKKPDVILMDIEMPVMNGFDASAEIRSIEEKEHTTNIPIISITSTTENFRQKEKHKDKISIYLPKESTKEIIINALNLYFKF